MQSDNDFEKILTDFFKKHDKKQLRSGRKPHKIAVAFKGRETEVMEHLCKKYNVNPKEIKGMSSPSPTLPKGKGEKKPSSLASGGTEEKGESEEKSEKVEKTEVEEPKSKKKLFIIIGIIVILAAAGAAGYFFKDKIFGNTTAIEEKTPPKNTE